MAEQESGEVTRWLALHREGDPAALDAIVALLYDELRTLAGARLRGERAEHTLGATALVNEIYLKLARERRLAATSRTQFFAVAASSMRRALVDSARARKRLKRGGGAVPVPLDLVAESLSEREADELLALEDALGRLAALSPRGALVVEQRFFAGMEVSEIAGALGVSEKTVQRDWVAARAWLRKEVSADLELG